MRHVIAVGTMSPGAHSQSRCKETLVKQIGRLVVRRPLATHSPCTELRLATHGLDDAADGAIHGSSHPADGSATDDGP